MSTSETGSETGSETAEQFVPRVGHWVEWADPSRPDSAEWPTAVLVVGVRDGVIFGLTIFAKIVEVLISEVSPERFDSSCCSDELLGTSLIKDGLYLYRQDSAAANVEVRALHAVEPHREQAELDPEFLAELAAME